MKIKFPVVFVDRFLRKEKKRKINFLFLYLVVVQDLHCCYIIIFRRFSGGQANRH